MCTHISHDLLIDLFVEKIKKTPITVVYPEYPKDKDPNDPAQVIQYLKHKFTSIFNSNISKMDDLKSNIQLRFKQVNFEDYDSAVNVIEETFRETVS